MIIIVALLALLRRAFGEQVADEWLELLLRVSSELASAGQQTP